MNTAKLFQDYFEYNLWANQRLLQDLGSFPEVYLKELPISFGTLHNLLSHAHYYEIKVYKQIVEKEQFPSIVMPPERKSLFDSIYRYSVSWLNWAKDFSDDGLNEAYNSNLMGIITALYNHGIYHRGQITATLSMLGYKPSSLDIYIFLQPHLKSR